jgi:hypothetical protein
MADADARGVEDVILSCIFVFSVMAALANALVFLLVLTSKRLRTFVNGFVVSLAVSDILLNLCGVLYVFLIGWQIDQNIVLLKWYLYGLCSASLSELGNLCAVTYERYLAVVKPFQYKVRIRTYFPVMIPVVWLCSFTISSLTFIRFTEISRSLTSVLIYSVIVIFAVVPLLIIVISYCYIFMALVKQQRVIRDLSSVHRTVVQQRKRREAKVVKMFAVVASLYVFSTIPAILNQSVKEIEEYKLPGCRKSLAVQLSVAGMVLSSLANPFIYTFTKQDFRQQIKKMFRKVSCHFSVNNVQPNVP